MNDLTLNKQAGLGDKVKPSDLPAPPKDAIRIVQACSNEGVDSQDLADIVTNDPVLTAELLRVANSPLFGLANQVKSVARAVTLLGNRALRNIVLCLSMRDALRKDSIPGFDIDAFWEDALHRAVSARSLAKQAGLDADECFTAGLLQDFGLLVMLYLKPDQVEHWDVLTAATPDQRRNLEIDIFQMTHDEVGLTLAINWKLPADLTIAMGYHHNGPPDDTNAQDISLCKVSICADWMASVYRSTDKRNVIQRTRALLQEHFDIDPEQADSLLQEVSESVAAAATAMGMHVGEQMSFEQVMHEANLRLAEENLSYQELTWRLEKTLEERDQIAEELQRELELAREVQKSLLPGAANQIKGIAGHNLSAKAVSGDFYDYFELPGGRVAFCLADVSGKGMNAALLMAKTASLFRCLGKGIHDPGKLLAMLNREIAETSIRGMFVTMVAGVIDRNNGEVVVASAGHLPVLHMGCTVLIGEYPATAPPLGISSESEFPNQHFDLQGGCLYLYTDGLLEARIDDQCLEKEGLLNLLKEYSPLPLEDRATAIANAVQSAGGIVDDDLTLLIIEGVR
ncbi:Serine phosphatase RsbU, regulator of sigma subunit [hydrothermal vent metagenome]|uniref:Serine phosphatase RsbU, regulator of sigma subunit n=1 Tax=hydrothermal vent metagenome TaxID=652676 RepID=A0A3B0ZK26_9ZZZZ